jgi:heavy metal sensor kinase
MWLDLSYSLNMGRDKTVSGRARRLVDLLEKSALDTPQRRAAKFDDFAQATPEGSFIQVFDESERLLYPAKPSPALAFPWPKRFYGDSPQYTQVDFSHRRYRIFSRVLKLEHETLLIFVAGQLEDNRALLNRFSNGLFWITPALLALCAMFGYFLSRHALDPVARLTASARSITIGNLSRRLPISRTGDELERLAETCNEMLARLDAAVKQITRFTADASHELRSPISFIRTTAENALRNPGIDQESAESFREIVAETAQASRLLDDMLTLARSDAGTAEMALAPVDFAGIVAEACEKIRFLAEMKQHVLQVGISCHNSATITGEASSLRRLVWILLDNAIKYTPARGRIQVDLTTANGEALLSVRDSGVGIPASALPHIFERFYRLDSSRNEEGMGLGLAIAKWIADVHHAAFRVESEENRGTLFQVIFTLAQ